MTNNDCIFCKIANKTIASNIIFENDLAIAFDDINPKAPVHILIVPKKHIETIDHLETSDEKLIGALIFIAQDIARQKHIDQEGYRLVFNVKSHGGQEVDHIHLHLLGGIKLGSMC